MTVVSTGRAEAAREKNARAALKDVREELRREIALRERLEREADAIRERERRTFADKLHRDLGQVLSAIALMTKALHFRLRENDSSEAALAARISGIIGGAILQVQALVQELRPAEPALPGKKRKRTKAR